VIGLTDRKSLLNVQCFLVVAAQSFLCLLGVSERVGLEVVVLLCKVLYVFYVSKRVALDLCLFLGSLAVLILHSVLLSHY
jgi:hypothetical protein